MTRTTQIYQSMRCSVTLYLGTNHRTCSSYYFSIEMQDAASVNLVTEAKETVLLFLKIPTVQACFTCMARSTQDLQDYGPYLRYETRSLVSPPWRTAKHNAFIPSSVFPHHDGRKSTMGLYLHLRFPTMMDGKAQWVYTLVCVSPPWRTAKHNVCPCLLRLCAVIAVSEPDHHADGARRLTIPPPPTHYFCPEHLSGLSMLVWHCTWSLNLMIADLPCFLFRVSLSIPSLPGVCCSFKKLCIFSFV